MPAHGLARGLRRRDLGQHLGSPAATPGKFIISPSPMMPGQVIASATSSGVIS
jgi:hypothetical protein